MLKRVFPRLEGPRIRNRSRHGNCCRIRRVVVGEVHLEVRDASALRFPADASLSHLDPFSRQDLVCDSLLHAQTTEYRPSNIRAVLLPCSLHERVCYSNFTVLPSSQPSPSKLPEIHISTALGQSAIAVRFTIEVPCNGSFQNAKDGFVSSIYINQAPPLHSNKRGSTLQQRHDPLLRPVLHYYVGLTF